MSGTITVNKLSSLVNAPLTVVAPGTGGLSMYSQDGSILVRANGTGSITANAVGGSLVLFGGTTSIIEATTDAFVTGGTSTTVETTGGTMLVKASTSTVVNGGTTASLQATTAAYVNGATATLQSTAGAVLVSSTGGSTTVTGATNASLQATDDVYVNGGTATLQSSAGAVLVSSTGGSTTITSATNASLQATENAFVNGANASLQATTGTALVNSSSGSAIVSGANAAIQATTGAYVNGATAALQATGGGATVSATEGVMVTGANASLEGTLGSYVNGGTVAALNATTMAYVNGANATITTTGTGSTAGISLVSAANATITSSVNGGNVKFTVTNGTAATASLTLTTTTATSGVIVSNVANPTNAQEAATKAYVDSVAVGLYFKQYCELRASSTSTPFVSSATYTYNAGAGTITAVTAGATFIDTLDSAALTAGGNVVNRVLITQDQVTSAVHAGIYAVTTAGAPSVQCVLTRTSDADVYTELNSAYTYVEQGTYTGRSYVQVNTLADLSASTQSWVLFSETSSTVYHIGPTTLSGAPADAVATMASVRRNTDTGYDQNYLAGGMILESQLTIQNGTTERQWGPALYFSSPNAAGLGRKGCIRLVATSNGNGDTYTDPTSTTIMSIQKFCWRSSDPTDPAISSVDGGTGTITTTANMRSSSSLSQNGDEVMFYGANSSNTTWVGGSLDPTILYFITDLTANGLLFNVTTTLGGANVTFTNGNIPAGANGIYAWRGIGTFG